MIPAAEAFDHQRVWHCEIHKQFHWREWEEEYFLFNPASGETHLLNHLSMRILEYLGRDELTNVELVEKLQNDFGDFNLQRVNTEIGRHLLQLEGMGLVSTRTSEG